MSEKHYTIWAYSATTNLTQREINLEGMKYNPVLDEATARMWAQAFAQRLNQQGNNGATDWKGRVLYEEMGFGAFVEAQNSQQPGAQQQSGD
jgi:hypothetical protein